MLRDEKAPNRIIIIGCPGSGKTTFAERLAARIGLPLFHLDAIWHKPDKTHISREEFDLRLGEILSLDEWIIDGNYSRTLERRISACDSVFLFDLPCEVCLEGALARVGKARADMPWVEDELDPWLRSEIEDFAKEKLPEIYSLLDSYKPRSLTVFKTRKQADEFLLSIG